MIHATFGHEEAPGTSKADHALAVLTRRRVPYFSCGKDIAYSDTGLGKDGYTAASLNPKCGKKYQVRLAKAKKGK